MYLGTNKRMINRLIMCVCVHRIENDNKLVFRVSSVDKQ